MNMKKGFFHNFFEDFEDKLFKGFIISSLIFFVITVINMMKFFILVPIAVLSFSYVIGHYVNDKFDF